MQDLDNDDSCVKFSDIYEYQALLGCGGFGKVVQAINPQGEEVAVKIIPKKDYKFKDLSKILSEASILSRMKHPNIVSFKGVRETDTKILIEMQLVRHGQLKKFLLQNKSLSLSQQRTIMKSIFSAVEFIHSHGVVHRDLKPENILIEDPESLSSLKIVDFGLSIQNSIVVSGQCGTLIYMAPELFTSKVYSKPVDIWSCGIILYMVCSGGEHPLYKQKDTVEMYKDRLMNLKWEFPQNFDPLAKNLFLKCVAEDPMQRYTANQILNHPFITGQMNDTIPLTLFEMYRSFALREDFIRIIKILMVLRYMKKGRVSTAYIRRCEQRSFTTQIQNNKQQELLDKDYVKEMMNEHIKIKARSSNDRKDQNKQKELPKYEIILKRFEEYNSNTTNLHNDLIQNYDTANNVPISEESSSIRNSEQSVNSYNKLIIFKDGENNSSGQKSGNIIIKRQFQAKKKMKKQAQYLVSSTKKPSNSIEIQIRSRSTTTNHKNNIEVKQFESPKKQQTLQTSQQFPNISQQQIQQIQDKVANLIPNFNNLNNNNYNNINLHSNAVPHNSNNFNIHQNYHHQHNYSQPPQQPQTSPVHQRKSSVINDVRLSNESKLAEIKLRNASTRKISIVESTEANEAYRYEQEKVVHSMFMPRGFNKKFPFSRNPQKYIVHPHFIELNAVKPTKASINDEINEMKLHDMNRTQKPPLPLKKMNQFDTKKK